ncbi:MAG: homoserine kinase [Gemmatimonadetes bacterium]|nr:homoserine kinase [Gemmatimonadota bacterium]MDA1102454.1 homoserine kinase [Gemmatimonadota bacterium]
MIELNAARVRVPGSTSNLGSGYDTIGLALNRYLDVSFEPSDGEGLVVERSGTLASLDGEDGPDLVATTFSKELGKHRIVPRGTLRLRSQIPVARGLGASAAAVLAGYDLARAVRDEARDDDSAFAVAMRHEGHGDNAAPSLFGGLRAVALTADGPVVIGLQLSERVGFAYAAPAAGVSTKEARAILPKTVPHKVAGAALGRVVALIRGLAEANPELIRIGMKDELHVPHRLSLIPSVMAAMSVGVDAGAWGVTISGAGSGLIALCDPSDADAVASAMHEIFDAGTGDPECVGYSVRPSGDGLMRVEP